MVIREKLTNFRVSCIHVKFYYRIGTKTSVIEKGRDGSVGKTFASQSGDPGFEPGRGLTRDIQSMNEKGRDYQL